MTTTVAAAAATAKAAPPAKTTTKAPAAADVAAAAATAELNIVNAYDITISKKATLRRSQPLLTTHADNDCCCDVTLTSTLALALAERFFVVGLF